MNYLNGDVQKYKGSPSKIYKQLNGKHRLHVFEPLGGNQLREKGRQVEQERIELEGKVG